MNNSLTQGFGGKKLVQKKPCQALGMPCGTSTTELEALVLRWEDNVLSSEAMVLSWEVLVLNWEVLVLNWEAMVMEWEADVM